MEVEIARSMIAKLERMETRLDAIHLDLVDVNERLGRVAYGIGELVGRLDHVDGRLERIEQRLGAVN